MKRLLLGFTLILLLTGCGQLLPSKRSENAAVKTAETIGTSSKLAVERLVEGEKAPPQPHIEITGSNRVDISLARPLVPGAPPYRETTKLTADGNVSAGSTETAASKFSMTVPLWVSLIGGGIGILILTFAVKYAINSSAALKAGAKASDELIAGWISEARERSMASHDPHETSRLNAEIASMESERAKLSANGKR